MTLAAAVRIISSVPKNSGVFILCCVAAIPKGRIERTHGLVYDQDGHVIHQR